MKKTTEDFFSKYPSLYNSENAALLDSSTGDLSGIAALLDLLRTYHRETLIQKENLHLIISCGPEISIIIDCCAKILQNRYASSQICPKVFKKIIESRKVLSPLNSFLQSLIEQRINIVITKKLLKFFLQNLSKLPDITHVFMQLPELPTEIHLDSLYIYLLFSMSTQNLTDLKRLLELMSIKNIILKSASYEKIFLAPSLTNNLLDIIVLMSATERNLPVEGLHIDKICSNSIVAHQIKCILANLQAPHVNRLLTLSLWKKMLDNPNRLKILSDFIEYCLTDSQELMTEKVFQALLEHAEEEKNPTHIVKELKNLGQEIVINPADIENYLLSDQKFLDLKAFILLYQRYNCKKSLNSLNVQLLMRFSRSEFLSIDSLSHMILTTGLRAMNPGLLTRLIHASEFSIPTRHLLDLIMRSHYECLTFSVFTLIIRPLSKLIYISSIL